MSTKGNESGANDGDMDRIIRDYSMMRLELIAESDLSNCVEEELKEIAKDFHSAQIKLLCPLSAAQQQSEISATASFDNTYRNVLARLREMKGNCTIIKKENSSVSAKLPKINIKPFDGKVENWFSFIQLFDSLIHHRDIPNVEKLHYLLSSVENNAYDLIKNFPLTNDSYLDAYETLNKHFNKKRQIATLFYHKLLSCEPVKSKSASELERVHRTFVENLCVLEKFGLPDKNFMLFNLFWSKLDRSSKEAFQLEFNSDEIPEFTQVQNFIEKQVRALSEVTSISTLSKVGISKDVKSNNFKKSKSSFVVSEVTCDFCTSQHTLSACKGFLDLDINSRFKFVKNKKLCLCCLSKTHRVKNCRVPQSCSVCGRSHHTLLHFNKPIVTPLSCSSKPDHKVLNSISDTAHPSNVVLTSVDSQSTILFSTAMVLVKDSYGNYQPVRVLLDCASACNFISEACAKRLGLSIKNTKQSINGIGFSVAESYGSLSCEIKSFNSNKIDFRVEAFVLSSICNDQPTHFVDFAGWSHIRNLPLADPDFASPGPIDMLLNADIFASSLVPGLRRGKPGQPKALKTLFGWILMGECDTDHTHKDKVGKQSDCFLVANSCSHLSNLNLDNSLKRFWEVEELCPPINKILSKEDQICEDYFVKNYCRNEDGRFVVPLPFENPAVKPSFSNSREIALKRFLSLERKLNSNPEFKRAYVDFMNDYEESGHMVKVDPPSSNVGEFYYIPHHGVLRPDSVSTPLRTVFDASCRDSNGLSLNDTLLAGPKLQTNIFDLLIRFRWHSVVFSGDVKQMYRQILVCGEDAEYQRILWRPSSDDPIQDYRLRTVTYGLSSAPFQALRTIAQLAEDSTQEFPAGSTILSRDIYVDDIVSGADSVEQALQLRTELTKILSSGGLHLRKWTSNCRDFFVGLPTADLYSEEFKHFEEMSDLSLKILGLLWHPQSDTFQFRVVNHDDSRCTKRTILSHIARIYDPLGFLAPVTFYAKYLMQLLWISGVSWDDNVPPHIAREWLRFKSQLSSLVSITIPRRMVNSFVSLQLHGFCDASERGYCAVIFFRVVEKDGSTSVHFCCAKSKVAPLRKLSIPRLELLAAVLLSSLMESVVEILRPFHAVQELYAWSDSTVTLAWIKSCPSKWKTFVANRVSHIQGRVAPEHWRHVSSISNAADFGSRGMLPADLVDCSIWWKGPSWLVEHERNWPSSLSLEQDTDSIEEEQRILSLLLPEKVNFVNDLLNRFSSLSKVKRVLSFCFRFTHNLRNRKNKIVGPLEPFELHKAFMFLVKQAQLSSFSFELDCLGKGSPNSLPKPLRKLSPFVDDAGILRVGGRLANADVEFSVRHPILLPRNHRLTFLVIDEYHKRFMHPGAQSLQNLLSQEFWILSTKRTIRSVISGCMKCFRVNPKPTSVPLMGNLPAFRVSQIKPFSSVAVDYGGPFDIALSRGRGVRTYKGYICVFVCTSTKAVHIELASELSTEAFLAALQRFIARRGRCSNIVSDQGRNFVGASNYLGSLMEKAAECQEIKFSFNPPGSPHFNGLAEAGIKSVKTHLSRVVGKQRLTFEEFYTVLAQIEAMLNSRPLTPLSSDANDLAALTPGHFLTLEPLSMLPEENFVEQNISVIHRWKLIRKMHQDFWKRWNSEYLHTLQQRAKWDKTSSEIKIGTLVLLVNEQVSPLEWKLGRITTLHPGSDGICRVVSVKTVSGEYKRPVIKVCPLPLYN